MDALASHLFYTQFLNERDPAHRELGMRLGIEKACRLADLWVFGIDYGVSAGMENVFAAVRVTDCPMEVIKLNDVWPGWRQEFGDFLREGDFLMGFDIFPALANL